MSRGILMSSMQTLKSINAHISNLAPLTHTPAMSSWPERWKRKLQMIFIAAAVGGIEFCYAAETAFVSPLLLQLGVPVYLMTLAWAISPLFGFFLVPILGSLSDSCTSRLGRRRPFIIFYGVGILIGLLLVPYGKNLGELIGDISQSTARNITEYIGTANITVEPKETLSTITMKLNYRGIILTVLGAVLLDFCCDACQTPCRTLMLDSTGPQDQAEGLTLFTIIAGLGGSIGYAIGGRKWSSSDLDNLADPEFFKHIHVVFGVVMAICLVCFALTLFSVREKILITDSGQSYSRLYDGKPTDSLYSPSTSTESKPTSDQLPKIPAEATLSQENQVDSSTSDSVINTESDSSEDEMIKSAGSTAWPEKDEDEDVASGTSRDTHSSLNDTDNENKSSLPISLTAEDLSNIDVVTLRTFLKSIIFMPKHMWILCLTNLCCWMSLVTYSLYFTDFMGQQVYKGNPHLPVNSEGYQLYTDGVCMGSLAMVVYSLSCMVYSFMLNKLIKQFGMKKVYICSQLAYTVGMILLACFSNVYMAFISSLTTGIMYATLFTLPYILVGKYHSDEEFVRQHLIRHHDIDIKVRRGLGTDVAIVSSMVFVGQFVLSSFIGSLIHAVKSTLVIPICAAVMSFAGAISATQVEYLTE